MKTFLSLWAFIILVTITSCKKEEATTTSPTPTNTELPTGAFTAQRSGNLTAQSGTPTSGLVQIGTDTKGVQFLKLTNNFKSDFHSGAVTLYLSKSATFNASNVQSINLVSKDGEQYFKVNPSVSSDFSHIIVWCGAAKIPFGFAELK